MNQDKIKEILDNHALWLSANGGSRAILCDAILCGANLRGANLRGANLRDADLRDADLRGANLRDAILCGANLCDAILCDAILCGANLCDAILCDAILCDANLRGAILCGADGLPPIACPEEGAFIGWKKANGGLIVKLQITAEARRCSATSRKCRCSVATVVGIEHRDGTKAEVDCVASTYDVNFVYEVGKTVSVNNFDEDRWNECSAGIHFFIMRQEAVDY